MTQTVNHFALLPLYAAGGTALLVLVVELAFGRWTLPAGVLGFAAIASLGLPGLAGFWGEAFAVVAAIGKGGPLWTTLGVLAALGAALAAAYFLRLLRRVTHGDPTPAVTGLGPTTSAAGARLAAGELVAWAPLMLLALLLGLVPAIVLGLSNDPAALLAAVIGRG